MIELYLCIAAFVFLVIMGFHIGTASPNEKDDEIIENIIAAGIFAIFWPVTLVIFFLA